MSIPYRHRAHLRIVAALGILAFSIVAQSDEPSAKLIAHWPLQKDAKDIVGALHGTPNKVDFSKTAGAVFDGTGAYIEIPDAEALHLGTRDFSLAVRIRCQMPMQSPLGDIVSKFDPVARKGINFHIAGSAPAYNGMSDTRHVHFGIDDSYLSEWEDHGKPWPSNSLITCLVTFDGELYCGIADADRPEDKGHVFRLADDGKWTDCGRIGADPDHHSVQSMIVHKGKLYAGTGIYNWDQARGNIAGLPAAAPTRVFIYEGDTTWRDLGPVGNGARILCMASLGGDLYAGVDSVGDGHVYKFDGTRWSDCGAPDGRNIQCLMAWQGQLCAATHGNIYLREQDGKWKAIGLEPYGVTQNHSIHAYQGKIHLGTWPQGYVLRYEGGKAWDNTGRLGLPVGSAECNEVTGLCVYNGKLYAGVIPKAECYRYESDGTWTLLKQLADRPDWAEKNIDTWNRLTCFASFRGKLWGGTGSCRGRASDASVDPSLGRIFSIQAGQVVSHEKDIGGEWTHLAAVRQGRQLKLYVNGMLAESSELREGPPFNLTNAKPLRIGFGAQNYFAGSIADLRLYEGALSDAAIRTLPAP